MPLNVTVVGAGIGGLCLANGLSRAGVAVRVLERGASGSFTAPYRLRIDPHGVRALADCLPPELFAAFEASCEPEHNSGSMLFDHQLNLVSPPAKAGVGRSHAVTNRLTLREILLAGLPGAVEFGREVNAIRADRHGVEVRLADGTSHVSDVLVGADGTDSVVRAHLLPDSHLVETELGGIHGRTPLTPQRLRALPEALASASSSIIGTDDLTLVAGRCQPAPPPFTVVPDHLQWTLTGPLQAVDGTGAAARLVADWHPALAETIAAADPASLQQVAVRAMLPAQVWPAGRVTLLGDAAHTTTPVGGNGASLALRDAALLAQGLAEADACGLDPAAALSGYWEQMYEYGTAAVLQSLRMTEQVLRVYIPELD